MGKGVLAGWKFLREADSVIGFEKAFWNYMELNELNYYH